MSNLTGKRLGDYFLERLLGTGGFSQGVYLAYHVFRKRYYTIKVHSPDRAEEAVEEFHHMKAVQENSPNSVHVYDYGRTQENVVYIVMQQCQCNLRDVYGNNPTRDYLFLANLVRKVSSILHYLHKEDFAHQDVKLENLLLSDTQEVLLSDYGSVRSIGKQRQAVGTLEVMPPEQIEGWVTPEVDQYALACMLFELLAGYRPFSIDEEAINKRFLVTQVMDYDDSLVDQELKNKRIQHERIYKEAEVKKYERRTYSFYWGRFLNEIPPLPQDIPYGIDVVLRVALSLEPEKRYPSIIVFAEAFADACMKAYQQQKFDNTPARTGELAVA